MSGRLKGKKALISGGASGIGAATAKRFIEEGARVVIGDINKEKGEAFAANYGDEMQFVELNVTSPEDWDVAMKFAQTEMGGITTIVNSAGISVGSNIEDITLETFRKTTAINLDGTFLGIQAGVKAMKGGQGGSIINVASTLGHRGGSFVPDYCASKGGVLTLTRAVALHCAEQGYDVRVNTISPGAIRTEILDGYFEAALAAGGSEQDVVDGFAALHPMKRLGRPNEAANAIVFLASDESSFSSGIDIPVDGGYLA
jgi:NAD(P)-dependent dehydrogenase (short-subunit alcohol dehydrogenase family)